MSYKRNMAALHGDKQRRLAILVGDGRETCEELGAEILVATERCDVEAGVPLFSCSTQHVWPDFVGEALHFFSFAIYGCLQ